MADIYIYALKDPHDSRVRYVGQAKNLQQRFALHLGSRSLRNPSNRRLADWIAELWTRGLQPQVELLETTTDILCQERERHWIRELASPDLLNIDEGGTGQHSFRPSFLTRMRMRLAYQRNPARREHILRLNALKRGTKIRYRPRPESRGQKRSQETRRRMSESARRWYAENLDAVKKKGRLISEAHKKSVKIAQCVANLRVSNTGRKLKIEHRRKMSESHKLSPKAQAQLRALNASRQGAASGGQPALFG